MAGCLGPHGHWRVTAADGGSWRAIADAVGCTREDLWQLNTPDGRYRPLEVGEVLIVPLGAQR